MVTFVVSIGTWTQILAYLPLSVDEVHVSTFNSLPNMLLICSKMDLSQNYVGNCGNLIHTAAIDNLYSAGTKLGSHLRTDRKWPSTNHGPSLKTLLLLSSVLNLEMKICYPRSIRVSGSISFHRWVSFALNNWCGYFFPNNLMIREYFHAWYNLILSSLENGIGIILAFSSKIWLCGTDECVSQLVEEARLLSNRISLKEFLRGLSSSISVWGSPLGISGGLLLF